MGRAARRDAAPRQDRPREPPLTLVETSVWRKLFRKTRPLDLESRVVFDDVVIRSSVDCPIAACAIRHDLEALPRDRDFDALAGLSRLRPRSW